MCNICGVYGVRTAASHDSKILHIWHDGCNGCRPLFVPSPRLVNQEPPPNPLPRRSPHGPCFTASFCFSGLFAPVLHPSMHCPCSIADWNLTTAMTAQVHHLQICPMLVRSNSAPRLRPLLLTDCNDALHPLPPSSTLPSTHPLTHTPPLPLRALIPSNHSSFHPFAGATPA
jgi:hypothetical protein